MPYYYDYLIKKEKLSRKKNIYLPGPLKVALTVLFGGSEYLSDGSTSFSDHPFA